MRSPSSVPTAPSTAVRPRPSRPRSSTPQRCSASRGSSSSTPSAPSRTSSGWSASGSMPKRWCRSSASSSARTDVRVLLLGMGSRGDVQPLVALGERLLQQGYAVSLAAPADLAHAVDGSGVRFEPLSFDLEGPLREALGREGLRGSARTQPREARLMRQMMAETVDELAADVERLLHGADAVVSGALTFDLVDALLTTGRFGGD